MNRRSAVLVSLWACAAALALSGCTQAAPVPASSAPPAVLSGGGMLSSGGAASQPPQEEGPQGEKGDVPPKTTPSSQPASDSEGSSQSPAPSAPSASSHSASSAPAPSGEEKPKEEEKTLEKPEAPKREETKEEPEEEEEEPVQKDPPKPEKDPAPAPLPPEPEEPEQEEAPEQEEDPKDDDSGGDPQEEPDDSGNSAWKRLTVNMNGSVVTGDARSIVAQIVQNEIGSSYPEEAVKAQAVAAYTFVRYYNSIGSTPSVGGRTPDAKITKLVKEVEGEQITYAGKPILASYGAMCAGWTSSSKSVWGTSLPYLVPVESEGDELEKKFEVTTSISASQVKKKVESALDVALDPGDKDGWFEILSYCDDTELYVDKVRVGGSGGVVTTGRKVRENILGLRSTAFSVRYDPGADSFDFITKGYGHGVGMSQVGAKYYAQEGWSYIEILEHYYTGAMVDGC